MRAARAARVLPVRAIGAVLSGAPIAPGDRGNWRESRAIRGNSPHGRTDIRGTRKALPRGPPGAPNRGRCGVYAHAVGASVGRSHAGRGGLPGGAPSSSPRSGFRPAHPPAGRIPVPARRPGCRPRKVVVPGPPGTPCRFLAGRPDRSSPGGEPDRPSAASASPNTRFSRPVCPRARYGGGPDDHDFAPALARGRAMEGGCSHHDCGAAKSNGLAAVWGDRSHGVDP